MRLEHHLVGGYVRYISPHKYIHLDGLSNLDSFSEAPPTRSHWSHIFHSACFGISLVIACAIDSIYVQVVSVTREDGFRELVYDQKCDIEYSA